MVQVAVSMFVVSETKQNDQNENCLTGMLGTLVHYTGSPPQK